MSRAVHIAFTKWGGAAHWTYDAIRLGEDEHGIWVGGSAGLTITRPGARLELAFPSLQLFPRDAPWTATFNGEAPPGDRAWYEIYIDVATPARWNAAADEVTMVDLDLDVVRFWDGTVAVLDEDEFAEHRVTLRYPAEIVELARASCAERHAALSEGGEPFATAFRRWLALVP